MAANLRGRVALVTGANRGIGLAIANEFVSAGMRVWMVARGETALRAAAETLGERARPFVCDVTDAGDRGAVVDAIRDRDAQLDVLVHNAGVIRVGRVADTPSHDLLDQLATNLIAPYELTRACLPMLRDSQGDIVFINSSAAKNAPAGMSQYSAVQRASAAFADALRAEVNADGIRVAVISAGRTATPRQESLYDQRGVAYRPELLMQPVDVADIVVAIISLGRTAEVTEVAMRPTIKSY
jgi:NADP-dependent 3-hydroxy acid dehydrogenase YdfG